MATPIKIKRSAVSGKRPQLTDLQVGELALNTNDGFLFTKRDAGGVGIGTTISNLTLWSENFGSGSITYTSGNIGIGTTNPLTLLDIGGKVNISASGDISGNNSTNITGIAGLTASSISGTLQTTSQPNVTSLGTLIGLTVSGSIDVDGHTELDDVNVSGFSTFVGAIDANGDLDVDGHTNLDNVSIAGVVTATTFVGAVTGNVTGNATGLSGTPNISVGTISGSTGTFSGAIDANGDLDVDGHTELDDVNISGVATATTFNGDLIIGTPTGGFKTGAFTINNTDKTKDSINDLNNILGKLVPDPPDTINGQSISLTGTAGVGRLCAGFTPTNNTGGSAPVAGTQYTRNTDSTVSTTFLTEFGPGDSGTVTGFVNAVGVGTTTLTTSNNDGTYDAIVIANNEDASNSTRNTGIASGFYQIYDLRMLNAASPDGFNLAKFTQGSSTTGSAFWYEDPSTVGAPVISFGNVNVPASPTLSYSSGIPHYTESTSNNFTYALTVTNATGDMYTQNTFLNSDGQTGAFQNPGNKSYTNFAGGSNPPSRNFGVGAGVTTLITQTPRNLHATVTSSIFTSFDASTPYGSHNNQRVGFTSDFNIMGTTADFTNNVDEDAIECTVGSLTGGSATRVPAVSGADNPSQSGASYSWGGGSAGSIDTYEAAVRGGDLRHDQTDYSTGYLPVGPDYSSGRGGSQYFQFQFIQSSISEFQISYTGSLAGCWVCMPDNSTWTTSLSGTNGWANMFQAYKGSGVPTTAEPGCSSGGVMDTNGGTFTCVFGTESSSNDSNNRVLIRFKLTSGNSISDISLSDT